MLSNQIKNKKIADARRSTMLKRHNQLCKTFKFKVNKSCLSKQQSEQLKMLFVEAKWIYNYLLSNNDNIFDIKTKYKELINITHKDKQGNDIPVTISHVGSSVKQELIQQINNAIKTLVTLKKKGNKIGKLKFKSEINSINLKQYGITHKIKGNKFKIQGIKTPIRVYGLKQLSKYKNIDYANAHLLYDGYDYFISLTCFIDKEIVCNNISYTNDIIGLDLGVKTTITCSNGEKINVQVEESERLKKLQAKLARQIKRSNNWYKTKSLIRKEYNHITNKKNDLSNKIVHSLLVNNRIIVIQDEAISEWKTGIMTSKVHHSILGRIKSKLKQSSRVIILDKWFPTTKYCSKCGYKYDDITLDNRIFKCPNCNTQEDRDIHAANNMIYFYLKYKDTAGTVDTLKPVTIKYVKIFGLKQEDATL